jgi:hypothetical protein
MMDIFSRRQWKKWAYGKVHVSKHPPKVRTPDEAPDESEYPAWLLPALIAASVALILIYAFLVR